MTRSSIRNDAAPAAVSASDGVASRAARSLTPPASRTDSICWTVITTAGGPGAAARPLPPAAAAAGVDGERVVAHVERDGLHHPIRTLDGNGGRDTLDQRDVSRPVDRQVAECGNRDRFGRHGARRESPRGA